MNLRIQIIDSIEALEEFLPEWLMFLETNPLGMNVSNEPRYLLALLKYNPANVKNHQLYIVVVREGDTICCIAPLSMRDHSFRLEVSVKKLFPIKIRQMQCYGGSFLYTNQPELYDQYFDAVFQELKQSKVHFDFLKVAFRRNSPFWTYCQSHLTGKPFRLLEVLAELQHDIRIHLPDSMETHLATLGKSKRKSIRHSMQRFESRTSNHDFVRFTEVSQIEELFNYVSLISQNSWQGKTFGQTDWKTECRYAFWKHLAELGFVRAYVLFGNGHPVAYRVGYVYNDTYYGLESRYDQAYSDLAPGIACLYLCLDDLMTFEPVKIFDFDFGTLGNKQLFANEEIESMTVYITATWKGTFLARTQKAINHFVLWGKRLLERWKVADRIRKILRNKK